MWVNLYAFTFITLIIHDWVEWVGKGGGGGGGGGGGVPDTQDPPHLHSPESASGFRKENSPVSP